MNFKLKNILVFLSILIILVGGVSFGFRREILKVLAMDYNCTSSGISQMSQRMQELTEIMKRCQTNSCFLEVRNELLSLSEKLQKCGQETQQKKEELSKEAQTLRWKINYLDASINEKQVNIYALNSQISLLNSEISNLNQQIENIEKETKKSIEIISYSLRKFYEYDKKNFIFLTLANGNFSDFFDEVTYVEDLQKTINKNLNKLRENKKILEEKKKDLTKKKSEIETAKSQIAQEVEILNYEREEKNNLLSITEGDEKKYEILMAEVEKRTREIYEQIYILEFKLGGGSNCIPNSLSWPVEGYLTQGYGCVQNNWYPQGNCKEGWSFHNGIDIASACGTPLKAPADGVVVATGDMGRYAYGQWMVIRHDIGVYTLYAHLQSIVATGRVKEGEIIAKMGTTGFSTGCHVHFMVGTAFTQNGNLPIMAHQNPLCYLR